jgi:polyhydroxybutyrate depolymerase
MSTVLKTWNILGTTREALVYFPQLVQPAAPILFVFHGHDGTAAGFARHQIELLWPEAIVVYAQGLPTPTPSDPSGTKPGWQDSVGEIGQTGVKDQDLLFFDEMLKSFAPYINLKLVFVHGFSNGGGLIYNVLWTKRGSLLAGMAVVAATSNSVFVKQPKALVHIAGKTDPVVDYTKQETTVESVRILNECWLIGFPYSISTPEISSMKWPSKLRKPVVFGTYDGGHTYPDSAPELVIKHLKRIAQLQ